MINSPVIVYRPPGQQDEKRPLLLHQTAIFQLATPAPEHIGAHMALDGATGVLCQHELVQWGLRFVRQRGLDLPRSPCCFDDMPCSQTPGMPDTALPNTRYRIVSSGQVKPSTIPQCTLTGLYHFNPKANSLRLYDSLQFRVFSKSKSIFTNKRNPNYLRGAPEATSCFLRLSR